MRLIDADALEPAICNRVCGGKDSCASPCLEVEALRNAETAEAIPLDYIREKAEKTIGPEATYLRKLLEGWK